MVDKIGIHTKKILWVEPDESLLTTITIKEEQYLLPMGIASYLETKGIGVCASAFMYYGGENIKFFGQKMANEHPIGVNIDWQNIDSSEVKDYTDARLLKAVTQCTALNGWGIIAEICKRLNGYIEPINDEEE